MDEMDNLSMEELRQEAQRLVRQLSDEKLREVMEECRLNGSETA